MTLNRLYKTATMSLMLVVLTLSSSGVSAADLMTIYRQAQDNDPVLESARYALEMVEQKHPQAHAGLLPTVSFNGSSHWQKAEVSFSDAPFIDRNVRNWNWSLQLSQPIFRPEVWIAYAQADAQVRQAMYEFRIAQQDLMLRAAQAYFDILIAQQNISVVENQMEGIQQQLNLAQKNFEIGTGTVADVYEARARVELIGAHKIAAANDLSIRRAELEKILGDLPIFLTSLKSDALLPPLAPANLEEWAGRARENNLWVQVRQTGKEIAEKEIKKFRAGHYPYLDLVVNRNSNFNSGSLTSPADFPARTQSKQIGLQFNLPLFSGGGVDARVREAIAHRNRELAELELAKRQAVVIAKQAFAGVINGQAQIAALSAAVESSKLTVEANKIGYQIGTRINIDVLNAEQQFYSAQRDLFKARVDTIMQALRLKAAAGVLQVDDLETVNALLSGGS